MPLFDEKSTDHRVVTTPRGEGTVFTLSPVIFGIRVTGHMEPPVAELIMSYVDAGVRRAGGRRISMFHDWLGLESYDPSCRQRLTTWVSENRNSFAEIHIAQRSKIVGMGVQVANLVLDGMLRPHPDLASLDREVRRALEAERRSSLR